jgi:hypothetical protein
MFLLPGDVHLWCARTDLADSSNVLSDDERQRASLYSGTAVLFKARDHAEGLYVDPGDLWPRFIKGGFSVRTVPGEHQADYWRSPI